MYYTNSIVLWLLQFLTLVLGDNYLILHPFYSGSHVLTLHHVAEALVTRGHKVKIINILVDWSSPYILCAKNLIFAIQDPA